MIWSTVLPHWCHPSMWDPQNRPTQPISKKKHCTSCQHTSILNSGPDMHGEQEQSRRHHWENNNPAEMWDAYARLKNPIRFEVGITGTARHFRAYNSPDNINSNTGWEWYNCDKGHKEDLLSTGTPCLARREHQPRGTMRLLIRDEQTLPTLFIPPHAQIAVRPHPRRRGLFAQQWVGHEVTTQAGNIVSVSLMELSDNSMIT